MKKKKTEFKYYRVTRKVKATWVWEGSATSPEDAQEQADSDRHGWWNDDGELLDEKVVEINP